MTHQINLQKNLRLVENVLRKSLVRQVKSAKEEPVSRIHLRNALLEKYMMESSV
jgi:hypothetical protein